jgi:hypothetical protein
MLAQLHKAIALRVVAANCVICFILFCAFRFQTDCGKGACVERLATVSGSAPPSLNLWLSYTFNARRDFSDR